MNYREYLYFLCDSCNLDDKQAVTMLIQLLLKEATEYHDLTMEYEKELKKVMTAMDFEQWTTQKGKERFIRDIEALPDDDEYKKFVLENMEKITGEKHG